MLFHTWPFALFFLVVYPVYLVLKNTRFRLPWLLAASYFFYACFNPLYLILIAYATLLDYTVVTRMAKSPRRKLWLSVSIVNNVALLGFFKYAGFVTENLNAAGAPGDDPEYGAGILDIGRVMSSDTAGLYDGAIASNYYLAPSEEDPVARLLVTVENRGTETITNTLVNVTVEGSNFPMNVPTLRPGDTRVLTLPVSVPTSTESIRIRSGLNLSGNVVDIRPANDVLTGEIVLIPEPPPSQ